MVYQRAQCQLRSDPAGSGRWHASRDGGRRKHNGIDFVCKPGELVYGKVTGVVTKHGYVYADDLQWRYIEVQDDAGYKHRFMYVEPCVPIGQSVAPSIALGIAQDITKRYPNRGMLAHVHYGVKDTNGEYINPETLAQEK